MATFDLRDVVRTAIARSEFGVIARRHTLAAHICVQPLPVAGDPEQLGLVITQVINAASKHAARGHGVITIRTWPEDAQACVCVSDNGKGPAEDFSAARALAGIFNGVLDAFSDEAGLSVYVRVPAI